MPKINFLASFKMENSRVAGDTPKISIITPSYNQGQYLAETIESIISQEYTNYELIIIDAGSTDGTLDVIRRYESHIAYWVSEPDRGQSHAIAKGLAHVTGDIVNWINSDDLLAPGALLAIAREFDLNRYDVLCGRCDYFVQHLGAWDLRNERMGLSATVGDTILTGKINQPSTFFKTSVFRALGVNEQFHYTMDLDLWYRYLLQFGQEKVLLSESKLSYFRLHEASKTVAMSPRFGFDIRRVWYNILFSTEQPRELLDFMRLSVGDEPFEPTRYEVNIPVWELESFIRTCAWHAVQYYNQPANRASVRPCLLLARKYGQPLNGPMLRQLIKHFLLPAGLVK